MPPVQVGFGGLNTTSFFPWTEMSLTCHSFWLQLELSFNFTFHSKTRNLACVVILGLLPRNHTSTKSSSILSVNSGVTLNQSVSDSSSSSNVSPLDMRYIFKITVLFLCVFRCNITWQSSLIKLGYSSVFESLFGTNPPLMFQLAPINYVTLYVYYTNSVPNYISV